NLEGDSCPYDLSKPLPMQGSSHHLTILVDFFSNDDLEYLKTGNSERKCTALITKTKAAMYELEGIEEMIPRLWSSVKVACDKDAALESYQKKLNLTKPQTTFDGISFKEPYTTTYDPKGAVYLNKSKRKRLMRADELYTFSDRTLTSVRKNLHERLQNFVLGYNKDMPKRKWTDKDQTRTLIAVFTYI
ncbi:hypothetical protein Tco_0883176, partial [Tanacetum coccineum]